MFCTDAAPGRFGAILAQCLSARPSSSKATPIYHIRGTPAQLVGIVYDAPDEQSAIIKAIDEFKIPANQHGRLIALRRD